MVAAQSSLIKRRKVPTLKLLGILGVVVVVFLLYILVGSTATLTAGEVFQNLFHPTATGTGHTIFWSIRMPRACTCLVVGATLGLVGSVFQALFRNSLAEPYIVGVSSGSAVGGALALVSGFGSSWTGMAMGLGKMIVAFPCGLLSLLLVLAMSRRRGVVNVHTMLLSGVVIGAMLSSVLSLIMLRGNMDTNVLLQWLLGNMSNAKWNEIALMAIILGFGAVMLILRSKQLNVFAISEQSAQVVGVNVAQLKMSLLVLGTAMVASTVGPVGIVGFLGLIAPHISRRLIGVDWRWSLIGSGLLGAALLLCADLAAQWIGQGHGEIPVTVVTAILGAPFLLALLKRE